MPYPSLAERLDLGRDRTGGPDACWPWTKSRKKTKSAGVVFDYGQIGVTIDGRIRMKLTHRVAYELHHGVDLTPDQCVLHRCDNPPCCNPAHLFLGDRKANSDDKIAKGRYRSRQLTGEEHANSKVTEEKVRAMRAEYATGAIGQVPLARKYGITQATAWAILRRRTWKHVA